MINDPKISVVMPAYNAEKYIREAIDSGWTSLFAESLSNAEEMIKSLGFAPYLQYDIKNDDDANKSYEFAKYAVHIGKQDIAEKIISQLYKFNPKSELIQKLIGEYPNLGVALPK